MTHVHLLKNNLLNHLRERTPTMNANRYLRSRFQRRILVLHGSKVENIFINTWIRLPVVTMNMITMSSLNWNRGRPTYQHIGCVLKKISLLTTSQTIKNAHQVVIPHSIISSDDRENIPRARPNSPLAMQAWRKTLEWTRARYSRPSRHHYKVYLCYVTATLLRGCALVITSRTRVISQSCTLGQISSAETPIPTSANGYTISPSPTHPFGTLSKSRWRGWQTEILSRSRWMIRYASFYVIARILCTL